MVDVFDNANEVVNIFVFVIPFTTIESTNGTTPVPIDSESPNIFSRFTAVMIFNDKDFIINSP